jgi:hypothetical protein
LGVLLRLIIFLVLVLCVGIVSAEIRINEVMYNPEGNDNNQEFIEIYSDVKLNLSDFIIGDIASNDSLEILKWPLRPLKSIR